MSSCLSYLYHVLQFRNEAFSFFVKEDKYEMLISTINNKGAYTLVSFYETVGSHLVNDQQLQALVSQIHAVSEIHLCEKMDRKHDIRQSSLNSLIAIHSTRYITVGSALM